MLVIRESNWKYKTSSSGALGYEFAAVEGGALIFTDPEQKKQVFKYGAVGFGISRMIKLPEVGALPLPQIKGKDVTGVFAPKVFISRGKVYILDSFKGKELSRSDITGACMFLQIGGGIVAGATGTAMLFGMNPKLLGAITIATAFPPFQVLAETAFLRSATGILLMGGFNEGFQEGGGGAAYIGGLV